MEDPAKCRVFYFFALSSLRHATNILSGTRQGQQSRTALLYQTRTGSCQSKKMATRTGRLPLLRDLQSAGLIVNERMGGVLRNALPAF